MCGIVGIAARDSQPNDDLLTRQCVTIAHRGPDDSGTWWSPDGRVGLGHRRLAIIDLSPGGHQPMRDAERGLAIVFNGEIYNYRDLRTELESAGRRFRTSSDTEVLLAAYAEWGEACVTRLNGMFAFAIYDARHQRLFAARDRAGEKPFFYRHADGRLMFASELKALMADPRFPRRIDPNALEYYFAYGFIPRDMCIFEGTRKLEPAHALSYDVCTDTLRVWSYWELPEPNEPSATSDDQLVDELEALLEDAVRRQLSADVPTGVLLSGGVDSSLVTAMASRVCGSALRTFTITFPGHRSYNEAPYAKLVADHFRTQHLELQAEPATVGLLGDLARQYDEPMADSSMLPTLLVSRLIRQHATVALGGDGGDELFGGYQSYSWILQQERVRRFVPRPARRFAGAAAAAVLPVGFRGRNYLLGYAADLPQSVAEINLFFDARHRAELLAPVRARVQAEPPNPEHSKGRFFAGHGTPLQQATATDFSLYMPDDILVKVDRASMLASLEVRAPFLDYRIIEFAFGRVPDRLRATPADRKIILRKLARRVLPPQLDVKRKQGFSIPLQQWLRGEWGRYFADVLSEADPAIFDRKTIHRLLTGQQRGLSNSHRLFALVMFELWRREYNATLA